MFQHRNYFYLFVFVCDACIVYVCECTCACAKYTSTSHRTAPELVSSATLPDRLWNLDHQVCAQAPLAPPPPPLSQKTLEKE